MAGGYRFDLYTPRVFGRDAFRVVLGLDLSDLLEPLLVSPPENGALHVRYPLQLNDGEKCAVGLGTYGFFGFRIQRGELFLFIPPGLADGFEKRVGEDKRGVRFKGKVEGVECVAYRLTLTKGETVAVKIPMLGTIQVGLPA
jgi:hypothetical protein